MLLSLGGRLASAEDEAAKPPDNITKMLLEYGEHGIIINGIIAWITMNRDMTAENILKQLMEKSLDKDEIMKSRETLKAVGGPELVKLRKGFGGDRREMRMR